jgi:cell division protein FtsL
MTRLNILLLALLVGSCFVLVQLQYESRRLTMATERARSAAQRLAVEYEQLVAQQRALAASARVQPIAQRQLLMRPAHPGITEYLTVGGAPAASAGGQP